MVTFKAMRIQEIVEDKGLDVEDKIVMLREIETDAEGLQRAASEGPMNDGDGWESDLREVRKALDKLGAKKLKQGAATL